MKRYVVLTREGVLTPSTTNADIESIEHRGPTEFLPGAVEGLQKLSEKGFGVIVIADPARSTRKLSFRKERSGLLQRWQLEVALQRGRIERIYERPHELKNYSDRSTLTVHFLRQLLAMERLNPFETFFVSDRATDLEPAGTIGFSTILVRRTSFLQPSEGSAGPVTVSNLLEAATRILTREANPLLRALTAVAPRLAWEE
ncbi:MAG TPA: hypothetical protein VMJ35_10700 [Dongiaceae bacterium]|nr:hypothetical protein [Dongiaceae bacterium]